MELSYGVLSIMVENVNFTSSLANLDQYQYLQILEEALLPFARLTFGHNFVYQDDNARPHRARTVVNFMETEGIEHMEWPAVSPDMNYIENPWSEVTRTMNASANQPTNLATGSY